jgi:hypothetical protein
LETTSVLIATLEATSVLIATLEVTSFLIATLEETSVLIATLEAVRHQSFINWYDLLKTRKYISCRIFEWNELLQ